MRTGMQTVRQFALSAMITTVLFTSGVLYPHAATAATYYAATSGNDASSGTQAQPFRTVAKGLSVLQAGDTLYIRGGTYNENIDTNNGLAASGTSWSNPITISGYPGETVVAITAGLASCGFNYVIFKDLSLTGGRGGAAAYCNPSGTLAGDQYVRFQNLNIYNYVGPNHGYFIFANHAEIIGGKVHDANAFTDHSCDASVSAACHGMYIEGAFTLVDGVEVYNVPGVCIHMYNGYDFTSAHDNIVRNNLLHNCGILTSAATGGLLIGSGANNTAYNNLVWSARGGSGITAAYNATNNSIYNNTSWNNDGDGIGTDNASNSIITNNIAYGNAGSDIIEYTPSAGITFQYNLCGQANPHCTGIHDIVANPLFVNAGTGDFHLQATSPAINAGISISLVTVDRQGTPRPQGAGYDIGAYEYSGLQLPTPKNLSIITVVP